MRLREEVEKLPRLWAITPWLRGKWIRRAAVLSILDERECVVDEYAVLADGTETIHIDNLSAGDLVSIYVRRK